jgi:uncharacterized protein YjbI with pentapeptide repeats
VPGLDPTQEELQVRKTAQRILATHLQLPTEIESMFAQRIQPSPGQRFWPRISVDLTGATLVDFNFEGVSVQQARFDKVTFQGDTTFRRADFQRPVGFDKARFRDRAFFGETRFRSHAGFLGATFQDVASFGGATFQGHAGFWKATFQNQAHFSKVAFLYQAGFAGATFHSYAAFTEATFQDVDFGTRFPALGSLDQVATFKSIADFTRATFSGSAWFAGITFRYATFDGATFQGDAGFEGATFEIHATFEGATFQGKAGFRGATFQARPGFNATQFASEAGFKEATFASGNRVGGVNGARVLRLDDRGLNKHRRWPEGYIVRPDPADPTRGTLVHAEQAEEPEPAVPPPDATGS